MTDPRNDQYAADLHAYFTAEIVDRYPERVAEAWHWDHTDEAAYGASVAELRERWRQVINPPEFTAIGEPRLSEIELPGGAWLEVPVHQHLVADGLLVVPEGATKLLVIQHGLGSTPERVLGLTDNPGGFRNVGQTLLELGYAILAPRNVIFIEPRNHVQDLARLAGTTIEGVELARCRVLLDTVAQLHPGLDTTATALLGSSWGGLAALYWTPLEDRFSVAASMNFFNDRLMKMVVEDPDHYITFAARNEHHAFLHDHLGVFSDAELASLICPRPFLVQHGDRDPIGWTPQIEAEFARARSHWDELGIADRTALHVHPGGHEIDPEQLVDWLATHFPPTRG